MNQLDLFAQPPAPAPRPVDLPAVSMAKNGGRPEVAFRHPDNLGMAWTGRGKPPRWVTEWIESGKQLEALRIPSAKS